MMKKRLIILLTGVLVASMSCTPASAQTSGIRLERMSKVGPELISLYEQYSSYVKSHNAGAFQPTDRLVRVVDDRVVIDAVASDDVNALKADATLVSVGNATGRCLWPHRLGPVADFRHSRHGGIYPV